MGFEKYTHKLDRVATLEINAQTIFEKHPRDLEYCQTHASWRHQDACEFQLFLYPDPDNELEFHADVVFMETWGCSKELISLVKEARQHRATWLLLYV